MRLMALVVVVTLAAVAPTFAQTAAPTYPYSLDPYKPSDADLLRMFGSVLATQTPISEVRKLDPYKPSEAMLRREVGGGIPIWAVWYPTVTAPAMPYTTPTSGVPANVTVIVLGEPREEPAAGAAPSATIPPAATATTILRPESNDGVWISFNGQRWISGGPAVRFDASQFTRVGDYGRFPVYRRGADDVIYLPTRAGLVAPYRLKR